MNGRAALLLSIALLLALGAVWIGNRFLVDSGESGARVVQEETVPVVVAVKEIPKLAKIGPGDVRVMPVLKRALPQEYMLPGASPFFARAEDVVGQFVSQAVFPNEPLVRQRLQATGHPVTPSQRVMAIRVDEVAGLKRLVKDGDFVDVLLSRPQHDSELPVVEIVAQDVRVVGPPDAMNKPIGNEPIMLELGAKQAELVMEAMSVGSIQLALRHPGDHGHLFGERHFVSQAQAGGTAPPAAAREPVASANLGAPRLAGVPRTVISGAKKSDALRCSNLRCFAVDEKDELSVLKLSPQILDIKSARPPELPREPNGAGSITGEPGAIR
ncbi:hypothetical protein JCM19379_29230 [Methyloparacoccus murrellii]